MQGSILFPPAATPSNDGQFPGSFSLPDGGANVATPGNVKTPGGTDAWGAGTMFGRQTPGRGGFGAEGTPAGIQASVLICKWS